MLSPRVDGLTRRQHDDGTGTVEHAFPGQDASQSSALSPGGLPSKDEIQKLPLEVRSSYL